MRVFVWRKLRCFLSSRSGFRVFNRIVRLQEGLEDDHRSVEISMILEIFPELRSIRLVASPRTGRVLRIQQEIYRLTMSWHRLPAKVRETAGQLPYEIWILRRRKSSDEDGKDRANVIQVVA